MRAFRALIGGFALMLVVSAAIGWEANANWLTRLGLDRNCEIRHVAAVFVEILDQSRVPERGVERRRTRPLSR